MEISEDMITQFGLMNKITTGHSFLDILLCLLVPIFIRRCLPYLQDHAAKIFARRNRSTTTHSRTISHTHRNCYWYYSSNNEPPNHLLQQAIIMYMNAQPELASKLVSASVDLCKAKSSAANSGSDSGDEEDSSDMYSDELDGFEVKLLPPMEQEVEIAAHLCFFR